MISRSVLVALLGISVCIPLPAQISRDSKFGILRTVIAEQAAARIGLPFGADSVELSETGQVNKEKLEKDIKKNGQSVEAGKVVTVTEIAFADDKIEIELDGGGKNKKSFLDRIQVGVGVGNKPKVDFAAVKKDLAAKIHREPTDEDVLSYLMYPQVYLDFEKHNFLKTGIDALPPEFQEAVKAKEARIGMDRSTVIMALGRPDKKVREKLDGVDTEDWIYFERGLRVQFVTFENNVVVRIRQY